MNEVFTQIIIWIAAAAVIFLAGFFCYWMIRERQSTKPQYYASSTGYCHHLPFFSGAQSVGREKEKEPPLTKEEMSCREVLSGLKGETIWHESIRAALASGKDSQFRNLICQLKSEAYPVPHVMESILGVEAFERVMEL